MNEASRSWSGPFAGQRVPINLSAIFIGFLAILMLVAGVYVIELFSDEENLIARSTYFFFSCLGDNGVSMFQGLYSLLPGSKLAFEKVIQTPSYGVMANLFTWFLLVWTFFGGAINRMIAYHISKQEAMSISAAFKFAWKHKLSLFFTPIMLALVIAFFCGCNYVAGWLTLKFPLIGPILFVALFFLVILSSIFIVVLGIGLIFGFNLISSSICTEGCEGVEGVITTLQYIYSRPWSYMIYHGFVAVSCAFLLWVGGIFVHVTFNTSLVGNSEKISTYIFDENWKTVEVVKRKKVNNSLEESGTTYYLSQEAYNEVRSNLLSELENEKSEEGKQQLQEHLNNVQMYSASVSDIWAYIQGVATHSYLWEKSSNEVQPRVRSMRLINFWHLDKFWTCIGVFLMIFYYATQYFVYGYLLTYVFASSTLIYFLMRKEIDATDFDEVWEDDFEDSTPPLENEDLENGASENKDSESIPNTVNNKNESSSSTEKNKPKDVKTNSLKTDSNSTTRDKDSESKKDDTKINDKKDPKATDVNKDGPKAETKKDELKKGDLKKDESKKNDLKKDEPKDNSKKDASKDDSKKDKSQKDLKKDESKDDSKDDSKKDESKKDESKDNSKKDEPKDNSKKDDLKKDEPKGDSKKDDLKKDESKGDSKKDDLKKDESKGDSKKDDLKKDETKDNSKKDDLKKDESKDELKKDEPKKEESKDDLKKDDPKDDSKKDETKDDSKKDESEASSSGRKVDKKEADSSTMAIPLIKRKPRKTSQKIDKDRFMD
ncbi:hypothetical protein [Candidatus Uabimicrobium sp. HlEnr_7]|uniref:hypothetical protein n=1 Tax=Candidatus Uabimicrobium helgolandensis TaxID=3095367 RepID=UPI003557328B